MFISCWRRDQRGTRPAPEPRCSTKPTIGPWFTPTVSGLLKQLSSPTRRSGRHPVMTASLAQPVDLDPRLAGIEREGASASVAFDNEDVIGSS